MSRAGLFVAIEGIEGSGRSQQFKLLADRIAGEGYEVETFAFPQFGLHSAHFVEAYMRGAYGPVGNVSAYTAAIFYALDRYEAAREIREALDAGKIVLANRFTGSSMAHQATKLVTAEERRKYFTWLATLEFQALGIPRPDKSFVLRVPAEQAQQEPDSTQEDDLTKTIQVYDDLCQLLTKEYVRIDCARGGKPLSSEVIHDHLWKTLESYLPPKPQKSIAAAKPTKPNPYIVKTDTGYQITDTGRAFLDKVVTSTKDSVYAFTNELSSVTIAAAMARLSRRSDDMRVTILDEFAHAESKDEQLLKRVITSYGDDSVQQLAGIHLVVEQASNLLTKKLEWGRLSAYLEQSTRYIYFDQKGADGEYRYYTPHHLDQTTKAAYEASMDEIFDLYSELIRKLTLYIRKNSKTPISERDGAWHNATKAQACDAARPVLPVATQSTVGIFASGQAAENLIMHLMSDNLPEAQQTGRKILAHARKVMPAFFERADNPERGGATVAYRANTSEAVRKLAHEHLSDNHSLDMEPVRLTSVWPRNELELIADMLYEHSDQPLDTIARKVASWPIYRKEEVFRAYIGERLNRRHRPGRALEKAHYSWDLVCDYGIFRDLQRHRMVDDLEWQHLTPRYGYDIPQLIDDAGLIDQYEKCFALSLELYSGMQAAGYPLEAQYATLLGHRMRWKVTYNAREAFHIHELRTSPQGHPSYRKLVQQMHEKLAEAHPIIAESMKFVNQSEDPELTRLAAERYSHFKQKNLGNKL